MDDNHQKNGRNLPAPKHASSGLYVKAFTGLKLRDKRTERLARRVRLALPWLEPSDYPAVRVWAELETLSTQVYAWLRAGSVVNAQGEGKRLLNDYRQLRLAQAVYSRELGMTPASRQAIRANGTRAAFDLPMAMAQGEPEQDEETAAFEVAASDGTVREHEVNGRFKKSSP